MIEISETVFRRNTSLGRKCIDVFLLHPVKDASLLIRNSGYKHISATYLPWCTEYACVFGEMVKKLSNCYR